MSETFRKPTLRRPDRVIVLNCFGRGGSGIVWRMIGSSPDVVMTKDEWHVGVFGNRRLLRKAGVRTFRSLRLRTLPPLEGYILERTLRLQDPADVDAKPDARACVIKLMDYHIVFSEMISRSFARATYVNLTRHPYGQCESLIRSGLSLPEACDWYRDVMRLMAGDSGAGAVAVRFEDVVARPMNSCDDLYRSLAVRWSDDGRFVFKIKPYGAARTADVDVSGGTFIRVGPEEVTRYVDASVAERAIARLTGRQRREIWKRTGEQATAVGYTEDGR